MSLIVVGVVLALAGLAFARWFYMCQKRSSAAMNIFYDFRSLLFDKMFVHERESLEEWRAMLPCSLYIDWQYRKRHGFLAVESSCEYFVLMVLRRLQELPVPIEEPVPIFSA